MASTYYRDVLLSQQIIPAIKQVAGDTFVFQQDSAPAHHAHDTIKLLQRERRLTSLVLTCGCPPVQTWIPSTTRSGASCSSGCMNHASTTSMSWSNVSTMSGQGVQQDIIDLAVSQWRQRLRVCVRAHGRHFEHLLRACVTQTCVESQYVRINYCWTLLIKITKSCLRINLWIFRFNKFPG